MINLIKCHLSYLLSKSNILIIIIITIILFVLYLSNSISSDFLLVKDNVNNYYEASIGVTKTIYCILACFMMGNFFSSKNDAYLALLLTSNIKMKTYFYTKILSIFISFLIMIIMLWIWWMLWGFIFVKGFVFEKRFISSFISIFLISLLYSLYCALLVIIIGNLFTFLIPTMISIFVSSIAQNNVNGITKLIIIFFPTSSIDNAYPYFGYGEVILLITILLMLANYLYCRLDHKIE